MSGRKQQPQHKQQQQQQQPNAKAHTRARPAKGPYRPRRQFRPLLLEVAGGMDDAIIARLTGTLRQVRNRYLNSVRVLFTFVASEMTEAAMFGDDAAKAPGGVSATVGASGAPLFSSPRWVVTANKTIPVLPRLYSRAVAGTVTASSSPPSSAPTVADPAERATDRLRSFLDFELLPLMLTHNTPAASAPSAADVASCGLVFKHYTHEATRSASFLIADRLTGAAVVVDPRGDAVVAYCSDLKRATQPRPLADAHRAEEDEQSADGPPPLHLRAIVATHCPLDISSGAEALVHHMAHEEGTATRTTPGPRFYSGLSLAPAGTLVDTIELSPRLSLRLIALPSFSPECVVVELWWRQALVAVLCGPAWGTDAAPRSDVYLSFPLLEDAAPMAGYVVDDAAALASDEDNNNKGGEAGGGAHTCTRVLHLAQANLKRFFLQAYIDPADPEAAVAETGDSGSAPTAPSPSQSPPPPPPPPRPSAAFDAAVARADRVVLFFAHCGYSNVSNQLDNYWASYAGDLARMRHTRLVLDTLQTPEAYAVFARRLPPLPQPPLFAHTRRWNVASFLRILTHQAGQDGDDDALARYQTQLQRVASPTSSPADGRLPVLVIDVRDVQPYHARHLSGAVHVPMSFPADAYGTKKAELWLQCIMAPRQPLLAVVAKPSDAAVVVSRLQLMSPGVAVEAYTAEELQEEEEEELHHQSALVNTERPRSYETRAVPTATRRRSALLPASLTWVRSHTPPPRLSNYAALSLIAPASSSAAAAAAAAVTLSSSPPQDGALLSTVVLDVRTAYEYKNGSHIESVHIPLAELCDLSARDSMAAAATARYDANEEGTGGSAARATAAAAAAVKEEVEAAAWGRPSPRLSQTLLATLFDRTTQMGLPVTRGSLRTVALYCAGGFRSLIAASLLRRALEVVEEHEEEHHTPQHHAEVPSTLAAMAARLSICDVAGGAFQIMTQRPDLWQVKDRSIVCIS